MKIHRSSYLVAFYTVLLLFIAQSAQAQFYQGYNMDFGKNRVQHKEFLWTYFRFKNFDTYFYTGGKELAVFTGKVADKEITYVEHLFDYRSTGRLQFMIFNSLSDMKQSNIGLDSEELIGNTGGLTKIVGNKVLIYFDGNREHLRQQIRAGIAHVYLSQLMYGGNFKDRLSSSVLLTIPEWYEHGLISYVSKGWGVLEDDQLRDGILSGKYKKFNKLLETESVFAGHSMWHYISENYGKHAIANLLYVTRVNRSIESAFINVLGVNIKQLTKNWLVYNQKYYQNDDQKRSLPNGEPLAKNKKPTRVLTQPKLSPDGSNLAYVSNDLGKYRVYITDVSSGKRKKVLKDSYKSLERITDYSFPLLAWHPTGSYLTVMREKKGKIWLEYYPVGKGKVEKSEFFYFSKVLDFSYSDNGQDMVLSGIQNGQSDIYVFNLRSRSSQKLTNDAYDDLNPKFINGSNEIIFSSNRVNDTLGSDLTDVLPLSSNLDIFQMDFKGRSKVLKRVTKTPLSNEMFPVPADSGRFFFLSDESGIYNRYVGYTDSTIAYIDTAAHYRYFSESAPQSDYARNIRSHDMSLKKNRYAEMVLSEGKYKVFVNAAPSSNLLSGVSPSTTMLKQHQAGRYIRNKIKNTAKPELLKPLEINKEPTEQKPDIKASDKIDINNYVFQSEFEKPKREVKREEKEKKKADEEKEKEKKQETPDEQQLTQNEVASVKDTATAADEIRFKLPKQRNYDPAFSTDYFLTQLDNTLQNSTYQAFTGGAFYFNPGLNILIKIGVNDLMNDYKITGGFRLAGDLNSNEYFFSFDNLKKKVDKKFSFYRLGREYTSGFSYLKVHTHEAKVQYNFPMNDLLSIRPSLSFRTDRIATLSTDIASLIEPTVHNYWGSGKVELVYDNTIKKGLNLYNGFKYKLFVESFRQIDQNETWMGVIGADFRYYMKVHRQIIWANRFATSTSFGEQKLIYYLGSQDNAIVPSNIFDNSIPIDNTVNYGFQAVATNLRGFKQNIRNGNSFALINSELRVPVFQYLLNKPIRSDFVRHFQIVTFFDIGTAWNGDTPYSDNNSFNTEVIQGNPVTVVLDRQVDPIVAGFGGGLRTRVFGYFLRADWAWGYEDGVIRKNIFYLSLGLDF